jgi:GPN-loop GTPase
MEELQLGPNGSLLYCMEYLARRDEPSLLSDGADAMQQEDHAEEWLQEVLDSFGEDDYIVFDCPGQAGDPDWRVAWLQL